MRIYIKDKPLRIKKPEDIGDPKAYDVTIDTDHLLINEKRLKGEVLILNASQGIIKSILFILHHHKLKNLGSVTLVSANYDEVVDLIKSKFKIIKAAGGVVAKKNKTLMIHRFGMWDLPKGKIEKKESSKEGAKREVEEECSVEVTVGKKICTTWHTYVQGGQDILKKTYWYEMGCLDDRKMAPQREEGIDEVKWMTEKEVEIALYNSYRSIRHVYKKYKEKMGVGC